MKNNYVKKDFQWIRNFVIKELKSSTLSNTFKDQIISEIKDIKSVENLLYFLSYHSLGGYYKG